MIVQLTYKNQLETQYFVLLSEFENTIDALQGIGVKAWQAKEAPEVVNAASEIKIRAERRAGEFLRGMDKNKGGRPGDNLSHDMTGYQ